jgi:hypothetical protein
MRTGTTVTISDLATDPCTPSRHTHTDLGEQS